MSVAEFIDAVGSRQSRRLRNTLLIGDALSLGAAAALVFYVGRYVKFFGALHMLLVTAVFVVAGLWVMHAQGLHLARVSAIRVVELTRITRSMALLTAVMVLYDRVTHFGMHIRQVATATALGWVLLVVFRSMYRGWLAAARSREEYCRRVVVIGADEEIRRLIELFNTHPELGVRVAGVIGERSAVAALGFGSLWLGDADDAEALVSSAHVSGVVMSTAAVCGKRLNSLIRNLQLDGVHVHISTGIAGIDSRRLRSVPLAHEPLLYVEASTLGRLQHIAKRGFDISSAMFAVVAFLPVMAVVAVAIKANDRGPVLFRQRRVGRAGAQFDVLKFRTMTVDAEQQLARLAGANERRGPLFKMIDDPRVTRIGKFLRKSSLDELPQLFNVLRGEMSLVGPRPALPAEVAAFSPELRNRESVLPGITGLWQVEARDNPSFEAYRRLDLFYVENWSITLDLLIIFGTVEQFIARLISAVRPNQSEVIGGGAVQPAIESHTS
ncbi:MAG: sugar transferase [Ilumatobacteraceae bacterium]